MSGKIFVISDPHFGHHRVLEFGKRPFKDVNEMAENIKYLWNHTVGKKDVVLVLGDWGWGKASYEILDELNGIKRIILGNHDQCDPELLGRYFHSVHGSYQRSDILFTHIPIIMDSFHNYEWVVHGHIHDSADNVKDDRYYNANMDALKYYGPVSLDEIQAVLRQRKLERMYASNS